MLAWKSCFYFQSLFKLLYEKLFLIESLISHESFLKTLYIILWELERLVGLTWWTKLLSRGLWSDFLNETKQNFYDNQIKLNQNLSVHSFPILKFEV